MNLRREDLLLSLRAVLGRPAESLLLVLGMALAVGATAAGLALAGRIAEQSRERLASPRYREIVVATRQQAGDMETPARLRTGSDVVLTADDLEARHVAPAVRYAYLANPTGFPLGELPIPEQVAEMALTDSTGRPAGAAEAREAAAAVKVIVIPAGGQVGTPAAAGARGPAVEAAAALPADGAAGRPSKPPRTPGAGRHASHSPMASANPAPPSHQPRRLNTAPCSSSRLASTGPAPRLARRLKQTGSRSPLGDGEHAAPVRQDRRPRSGPADHPGGAAAAARVAYRFRGEPGVLRRLEPGTRRRQPVHGRRHGTRRADTGARRRARRHAVRRRRGPRPAGALPQPALHHHRGAGTERHRDGPPRLYPGRRGGAALRTTPACGSPSPIPAGSTRRGRNSPATSRPPTAPARW